MLNGIEIENEKKGVHTVTKHYFIGSSDVIFPTKLNRVKKIYHSFQKEQDADNIYSAIQFTWRIFFTQFFKNKPPFPILFITPKNNLMMTTIGINGNHYLPESEDKKDFEKKILPLGNLETILFKNTEINKQPGNFSPFEKRKKTRLLVRRGVANILLLLNDVAAIYTNNKLVYVIDRESKKYSIDKTLTELEEELDPAIFFRANRQYIININFVKSFKAYRRVKLIVDINIPEPEYRVCISQHVAHSFKKWMNDA